MEPLSTPKTVQASGLEMARAVWHRRKWPALLVFVTLVSTSFAVARSLPSIYGSAATLLVERPQAPDRPSGPLADVELETRLRTLSQQIQSRERLDELVAQFNLYPDLRRKATPDAVVEQMRKDITLQFKGVTAAWTGLNATFAFSLSYRGRDPETVAQVANVLAADFVEESTRTRERETARTTEFLRAQVEEAGQKLKDQEQQLNEFTARYGNELPDRQAPNLAALGRLNEQLVVIMYRRNELTRQLAQLTDPGATSNTIPARLAKLRLELADLRAQHTDEYPDVVRVKQEIADLERQLQATGGGAAASEDPRAKIEAELKVLQSNEQAVRREIARYEQRVNNASGRTQEFQRLSEDYATAKSLYQSLLQRLQDAQLAAASAQQRLQGEQFSILDPAVPSSEPVGPHRLLLMAMGLFLSAVAAIGTAYAAEWMDTSFHSIDDMRAFTSVPVLVSIPPILTETDLRRRGRRFRWSVLAATLGVGGFATLVSHLHRVNEVLARLLTSARF
ncbi:MAG: hypothetical protein E6K11_07535 [Methanobacteriota archaeon]|nr:MAG: hypothetical protein E6K11_07535 [Euryarchaeota archaeon]